MEPSKFADTFAENVTLAGVVQYGQDAFVDAAVFLRPDSYSLERNQVLFEIARDHFESGNNGLLDYPTTLSIAKKKGYESIIGNRDFQEHFAYLRKMPVELGSITPHAAKILKLKVGQGLDLKLKNCRRRLNSISGEETMDEILAIVETEIFNYIGGLSGETQCTKHIAEGIDEWFDDIEANPRDNIGVPTPFPIYNELLGGGFRRGEISIMAARPKQGKAQVLTSQVFTPNGPVLMGDIAPGDRVSTPFGGVAKVLSVYPQGYKDIYRVVFADGDSTECCIEHLWEVKHRRKKDYQVMTLGDIVSRGLMDGDHRKWQVRLPDFCYYEDREVPIDPYLLGLLIGNGGLTTPTITFSSADPETVSRLVSLLPEDHGVTQYYEEQRPWDYRINSGGKRNRLKQDLDRLGLLGKGSHDKFVPEIYKYNSREVRLAVLQGLCDTDGSMGLDGKTLEYSTVSKRLAEDVKEMVLSLGGLCHMTYRKTRCQTGEFWSYRLNVKHNDKGQFFRLARKKDRARLRKKPPLHRTILRVEYVGKKPAQCIMLDSADHLYMTDHHIVTHNTTWLDNVALHVAGTLNIPVLNLDTEMSDKGHWARILAHLTGIPTRSIERGDFSRPQAKEIRSKIAWLKSIPYFYRSVLDETFEEQVSAMRRWVIKEVGKDDNGVRNNCLVLYDYLQLTDPREFGGSSSKFAEYQILGFQMVALARMAKRYDIPILSMLQLNKEGWASGSDRIVWKCQSFSKLARKNPEEIARDGKEEGTSRVEVVASRYGPETEDGDYINMTFDRTTSKMTEGKTYIQLQSKQKRSDQKGLDVDIDPDERFEFGDPLPRP